MPSSCCAAVHRLRRTRSKNYALANGPAYQHPRRVFFLEQLPLAGTNKVDREQLRSLAAREAATADRATATR